MTEDVEADGDLPRAVALAWGVAAHPTRGPKRELSIERIVDAAIELADEGGLAAVSMNAVATRLGFTPMSLYRYVSAKDDLVLLMQERGIGVPPDDLAGADDRADAGDWRAGLEAWTRAMAGLYVEHPWLLDIPITGVGVTPNNLAWLDTALAILDGVPLHPNAKLSVVLALLAQGRFEGIVSRGYDGSGEVESRDAALMAQLVTPEQFPHVHAAFAAGAFSDQDDDPDPFSFGRARVLDGVEAVLQGRAIEAAAPHRPDPADQAASRDPKVKEAVKARREAEKALREARKREREQLKNARERARKRAE
ncbi:TetR/AcrR family transcriptional regulator [Pseudolysinimonas kribbensis]|uniref:TetR family transcriptional regulator n=1 Tax=Pseudolysinimonas kribbensis TaxID=433641 RepID=A0ABQ6KCY0_9MICO|nr:TetR family transcriptional regulator [Pseudolysinimonas kribbensis]GMA96306.1 TetR family transcriptional regulator [Pseudolysinimonas kribbensis]